MVDKEVLGALTIGASYVYYLYSRSVGVLQRKSLEPLTILILTSSQPQPRGADAAPPIALTLLPGSHSTILDGW